MSRKTIIDPESGTARTRLLDAARSAIREKGFAATSVDTLCQFAGVTKGAYFHHFKSKVDLGVAAANDWSEVTGRIFKTAPYHQPKDPVARLLAYVDFRIAIITGEIAEFTCVVGTMAQEVYIAHPVIRDACGASIAGHAATLEPDIELAIAQCGLDGKFTARSLALHMQSVIQGAFVLAKALDDPEEARSSLRHLRRYIEITFYHGKDTTS